jgi:hypothetical protein
MNATVARRPTNNSLNRSGGWARKLKSTSLTAARSAEPCRQPSQNQMPHYKYFFIELFGVIGCGTPDDPGSDYCFVCAIEAANTSEALAWGRKVHSDFDIARTMFTDCPSNGKLYRDGEIEGEVDVDELLRADPNYAICSVGQFPNWILPWKSCRADGVRPASQPWSPRDNG